ncbi:branched-chain amino acid ABC transporter ATP-binding protein [Lacticaseibacillus yichunensis]|uniref:Branched-chain amino acid ABC transporter ATP-binding protein n=1 Tax=Lacticaseibacillus yichunensis TaxID=2486015 RepID=A0ABW4CL97_9LACO|nr:branched-chain amino acid ABC transporter ATP-binding protein [Lacticaseibacillus yichunensis]
MQIFHVRAAQAFATRLDALFAPSHLYYLQQPSDDVRDETFRRYGQTFIANGASKLLATITLPDAGLVPYLTVRGNLLINGESLPFDILPENLRRDSDFLDQQASALTDQQSLYIQLFRGLLAGRQYLLMRDLPASMDPQERRLFLACAEAALAHSTARLLMLTTDAALIAANPQTSFQTPPDLLHDASMPNAKLS